MKKIIGGKIYNTATAERLAQWDNGCGSGDFDRCEEALYRTSKGAFFIAGSGGARSFYSTDVGNGWTSGGAGLRVVTEAEARDWMIEHGSADEYVAAFGEPEAA